MRPQPSPKCVPAISLPTRCAPKRQKPRSSHTSEGKMADSQTPAPLSDAALDDLDRLAKAATPGPWVYNSYSNVFATTVFNPPETPEDIDDPEHKTVAGRGPDGPRERNVDLAYIAAAHPTT